MSSFMISDLTLWIGVIAAVAAIIAALPQIPVLLSMVVPPKPSIEIDVDDEDDSKLRVILRNGRLHELQNVSIIAKFCGSERVRAPFSHNANGMIMSSDYQLLDAQTIQRSVSAVLSPNSAINLGELQVSWLDDSNKMVEWAVFVSSKKVKEGH